MAVLCYLGVLVFIPIFAGDRQSEYLKLHKNQGLILFIIDTLVDLIENNWGWSAGFFSQITGGALDIVYDIVKVAVLILWLMGLTYACRGTKNELPGIGKIKNILKTKNKRESNFSFKKVFLLNFLHTYLFLQVNSLSPL